MKRDSNHRRVYSPGEISHWVARYRASDLGLRRFAEEHQIPAGRLHYWVYQVRRSKPAKRRIQAPVFQELKLPTCLPAANGWAAEVSLSRGLAVRFAAVVTPAWISSVVEALQRPC